jgi:hypothetical protein
MHRATTISEGMQMSWLGQTFGIGLTVVAAAAYVTPSASAGVVTGSPVAVFSTADNSKDIVLSPGTPTFTSDLSTYATFTSTLHDVLGVAPTYPGFADVEHQDASSPDGIHGDIALPYAMVGRHANGEYGHFIWKVTLAPGYETGAGAQINAGVYFRQDPNDGVQGSNALLGILDTLNVYSDSSGPSNFPPSTLVTAQDVFGGAGYHGFDTYTGAASLAIPAGKTEFYVDFTDQGSSARWALTSFSISANPVAVPEPMSIGFLTASALLLLRPRREEH